jgi:outer membrane immunogenic protein
MRYITRLGAAATAALGASLAAQAADLGPPVSRAPVYKEPVYSWAGFYAGVNAGYGWSRTEVDPLGNQQFCDPFSSGCFAPLFPTPTAQIASIPPSLGTNARGAMLGGQAGFNYQYGYWVAGVEADLEWTSLQASGSGFGQAPVALFPGTFFATTATADQRLRYFGTLRGRLGYLVTNPLLVYVTGGLAYGGLNSSTTLAAVATGPGCGPGCGITSGVGSESAIRTGWTLGGGLEYLLAGNWTVKAEYLYFNLGSTSYSLTPLAISIPPGAFPFSIVGVTSNTADFKGNLVRVGLNYKFAY